MTKDNKSLRSSEEKKATIYRRRVAIPLSSLCIPIMLRTIQFPQLIKQSHKRKKKIYEYVNRKVRENYFKIFELRIHDKVTDDDSLVDVVIRLIKTIGYVLIFCEKHINRWCDGES